MLDTDRQQLDLVEALMGLMRRHGATHVSLGEVVVQLGPVPPPLSAAPAGLPAPEAAPPRDPSRCACGHDKDTEHNDNGCFAGGCAVELCLTSEGL